MLGKEGGMGPSFSQDFGIGAMLAESRLLLAEGSLADLSGMAGLAGLSPEMKEIAENLSQAIQSHNNRFQYEIIKFKLANKAFHTGLWDMDVVGGDPVNPENKFIWSDEFRKMLGFSDENDFPNKLNSWSDRLHPEDKQDTLDAFERHLTDVTGNTPYEVEYRLMLKNGEYRHFQALGETIRTEEGVPLRVAGMLRDIHNEKMQVEALKQARDLNEMQLAKLGLVFQASETGLWDMDVVGGDPINPENKFIWSDEFRKMLGFSDENDFPNKLNSWSDRLHPEDKQGTLDAFEKHLTDATGQTHYNIEYRLLKKNGEYGHFRAFGESIRGKDGIAIRVAGALKDITEEKRLSSELARQRQEATEQAHWYESILNATPVPISVQDADMRWTFVNKAVEDLLGKKMQDLVGKSCSNWNAPICNTPDCAIACAKRGEKRTHFAQNRAKYEVDVEILKKMDGSVAGYIEVLHDITKIKEMEERAIEQAHWYESILNATPVPISVQDADMRWTFFNKAVEDLLGKKLGDMIGEPCNKWNAPICNTPDCAIACAKRGEKRTHFAQVGAKFEVDVEILKKIDGSVAGYIEVLHDITKIKEMEEAALAASRAKSQFLANMSHEIRTPMNAILGIADIHLLDEKLSPNIREALQKIHNSGDLLLSLINDILDLSKIESGKLELMPAKYDVASLINDTTTINIMRIGSKQIDFELCMDENVPSVLIGDELRIKQVLNNVLSNAFKYTAKGNVRLTVSSEPLGGAEPQGATLVFQVSDTGQGMTEEQLGKLFDEYSRFNAQANRTTEGTGLGMSITKNLVSMMNGQIAVASKPGEGTTFTIRLPQEGTGASAVGKELAESLQKFRTNAAKQIKQSQIVFEPMPYGKVLVVDDVESNLYVARGLMAPYGLSIETAMSGFEAIEIIKSGSTYDILFMDHMMPEMDGIEATKIIRGLGYSSPIVALTANAVVGQSDIFLASGFDDFISKPIDLRLLNSALKKYIRDKQPPEALEAARKAQKPQKEGASAQPALDPKLAEIFVRDASRAKSVLEARPKKCCDFSEEDMRLYIINVHAMKSALANIGENALSETAAILEQAGRSRDGQTIDADTKAFLECLASIMEKMSTKETDTEGGAAGDPAQLKEKLAIIKDACASFNKKAAKAALADLRQASWPHETKNQLSAMSEHLLDGDFDKVVSTACRIAEEI